jgi:hypothetical protein
MGYMGTGTVCKFHTCGYTTHTCSVTGIDGYQPQAVALLFLLTFYFYHSDFQFLDGDEKTRRSTLSDVRVFYVNLIKSLHFH